MAEKMTDAQLAAIAERAEKATKPPWYECLSPTKTTIPYLAIVATAGKGANKTIARLLLNSALRLDASANTTFIAHSREDVPKLLSHIAAQAKEIEVLKEIAGLKATIDRLSRSSTDKVIQG